MESINQAMIIGIGVAMVIVFGVFATNMLDTYISQDTIHMSQLSVFSSQSDDLLRATVKNTGTSNIEAVSFTISYEGVNSNLMTLQGILFSGKSDNISESVTELGEITKLGFEKGEQVTILINATTTFGSSFSLDPITIIVK